MTVNAPPGFETPQCLIDELERTFANEDPDADLTIPEIDSVDPFVAMLAEPASQGSFGVTMSACMFDQFLRVMGLDW